MAINYSLIAKKPLITWQELVELLFGCEDITWSTRRYDTPENHLTRRVQKDFKVWVLESLEVRELMGVDWDSYGGTERLKFEKEVIFAWIQENDVFDWLWGEKIEPPEETIALVGNTESVEELQEEKILPAPLGTAWEEVTITLIARDTVSITIGNRTKRYSYAELGMSDKRTGDKPKLVWWFFVLLIKENGFISKQTENYDPKLPDLVKQFKVVMKKLFIIEDEILTHYKKEKGYRAKFKAVDKTHGTYQEILMPPETS
jgi:hypothetical protein